MRLADPKHNSWIEATTDHGIFRMDAQVRLSSLLEMYAVSAALLLVKILIWKRCRAWWVARGTPRG